MYTVYKHLNENEEIIYVGKSKSLLYRQRQHKDKSDWFDEIDSIEYCTLNSKTEMDLIEIYLINTLSPKYNKKDKREDDLSNINLGAIEWLEFDMNELVVQNNKKENKIDTFFKPNELISMDISGLVNFQYEIFNCILYNHYKNKSNIINIMEVLKFISSYKTYKDISKENSRIKMYIDSLKYLKINKNNIFNHINYSCESGDLSFEFSDYVKSLYECKGCNIPILYLNKKCKFETKNLYIWLTTNKPNSASLFQIKEILGLNYKVESIDKVRIINYNKNVEKYSELKDFKRYVLDKIKYELSVCYNLNVDFEFIKFNNKLTNINIKYL